MRKKKKGQKRYAGFLYFSYKRFPYCQYCNSPLVLENDAVWNPRNIIASTDHIIPRSKGGTDDWSNLVISCKECNETKASNTPNPIKYGPISWQEVKRREDLKRKKREDKIKENQS